MRHALNDYNPVAHLYDKYVRVDLDVGFFVARAASAPGPVLELMAGTGRVSVELLKATQKLTCVDSSAEMLRVFRDKIVSSNVAPRLVCADVRSLPLGCQYDLALIPFNSFSELTDVDDRRCTLAEVLRVLSKRGRLICTLHNPAVRKRSLDGKVRTLGSFDMPGGRRLELRVKGLIHPSTALATSEQTYSVFDGTGRLIEELYQQVRFALVERAEFESMALSIGFEVESFLGDYDESAFSESSPFMIWTLRKSV